MLPQECPDNTTEEGPGVLDCNSMTGQVLFYTQIPNMLYFKTHGTKKLVNDLFEKKIENMLSNKYYLFYLLT